MTSPTPRPMPVYDPNQPLTVAYSDVLAARNVVLHLIQVLTDTIDPPSEYRQIDIKQSLALAVNLKRKDDELDTLDDAVQWLKDLLRRLNNDLPYPEPGTYQDEKGTMIVTKVDDTGPAAHINYSRGDN